MRVFLKLIFAGALPLFGLLYGCINNQTHSSASSNEVWLTDVNNNILFEKQTKKLQLVETTDDNPTIYLNEELLYQSIDGFGFTLNGGSARLINELELENKKMLLTELFSTEGNNIGINYLRLSVAASDLSDSVFSYNDLPEGEIDSDLSEFNMDMERVHLIPILKEILAINPEIKIMGSPWSAPAWMKTNNSPKGGNLKYEHFETYALYLIKYIQEMKAEGIIIDALTIQNEPLHPGNNPSMYMSPEDQALFIKQNLGPAFDSAGIQTKIIIYDHNADHIEYPISILNDGEANKYIDGSAFHLYGGQISALMDVHKAHPDKNLYFTEQWIGAPGDFKGDFNWHINNIIIGATRNWCKTALEWNLAADENSQPHTDNGGCTSCLGALTITGNNIERNAAYYIIGHASKFVRTGSVRIKSNLIEELPNVAFKTPEEDVVVIVQNTTKTEKPFNIVLGEDIYSTSLAGESVATFVFKK